MPEDVLVRLVILVIDGEHHDLYPSGTLFVNPNKEPWPEKWVLSGSALKIYT